MKLLLNLLIFICIVIGAGLTAHSAHLFDQADQPISTHDELENVHVHNPDKYRQFLVFFPIAISYFAFAVLLSLCPNQKLPYYVLIVMTSIFLILVVANEIMNNELLGVKLQTKYHQYIDFPVIRVLQAATVGLGIYIFHKRFGWHN